MLTGNPKEEILLGSARCRWEDSMDLKEIRVDT
jgi:hypothetical protein